MSWKENHWIMALAAYNGTVKGDRLSDVLLHRKSQAIEDESGAFVAPSPIVLGLNSPMTYKIMMKFYNNLYCPIQFEDLQLLMCPVLSNTSLKYYEDTILPGIPASSVSIRVDAYTYVEHAGQSRQFELAARSNDISMNALARQNVSHQYIEGAADISGYNTQFGSLGLYYNDAQRRLNPVTIRFNNLIILPMTHCYFVFEVVDCSNTLGGFAIAAREDERAINFSTIKSSGILKNQNGKWEPASFYRRQSGVWVKDNMPSYQRDTLQLTNPYNPNGTPE